ncbi:MAG: Spy/CpxP family protein refolding chaperone [Thermostichales cyanobacterium BF4_bins_65]
MKLGKLLIGMVCVLSVSQPVLAQPRPRPRPERPERLERPLRDPAGIEQLDLSPEQRQQLAELRAQQLQDESLQRDRQALRQAREHLRRLIASDASAAEIRRQHQLLKQIQDRLEARRLETLLALREILTPAQRQQLENLRPYRFLQQP